jgi:tRNA pseudouridine55 synthase
MPAGILNVNKPPGETSFSVTRSVRRLTGVRHVGHAGTLDPAAEGVLPILIGAATRLADFTHEWPKAYLAKVQLGANSDTYDREGTVTLVPDAVLPSPLELAAVLPHFLGDIQQIPPMYSAVKQAGEPLYRKARRGETVERPARTVHVIRLSLRCYEPDSGRAELEIECGKGMYVRSLVHDLGVRLGCGAYLTGLTRTAFGPLRLVDAVQLRDLMAASADWPRFVLPMDLPLRQWPAVTLESARAHAVRQGQPVAVPEAHGLGRHRVLDGAGNLLAWGEVDPARTLQPRAVFPQ